MTHVVTEPCILCKHTECVEVCPVDCFKQGHNFLVIDPLECIDCGVCIPVCPVNAIYSAEETPPDQQEFIAWNASLARHPEWETIVFKQAPLVGYEQWTDVKHKREWLS